MSKKYIVRLCDQEREACHQVLKKYSAASQKARRAQILLKSDVEGPAWTDDQIAEAVGARTQTIEKLRKRLVTEGFDIAWNGKTRETPPTAPLLDAQGEAKLIALRLGQPPEGYGQWTLQLLADQLGVVESISHETVRRTLKKTPSPAPTSNMG